MTVWAHGKLLDHGEAECPCRAGLQPSHLFNPCLCACHSRLTPSGGDAVNHPSHYGGGDNPYETIKVLEAWLTPEEVLGFCKGNAIKYLSRAGKKDGTAAATDLDKSCWYAERAAQIRRRLDQPLEDPHAHDR